jgi:hypothetical protein
MNLSDTVSVIITGPLFLAVADGSMGPDDMIVALPFIGVDRSPNLSEGMNVFFESFPVGMMHHTQPHLSTITTYGPNDRGAVIIVSAMTRLFIGPTAGWIIRITVIVTFFPPRSETSRQFQSVHLSRGFGADRVGHWLESPGVLRVPFDD